MHKENPVMESVEVSGTKLANDNSMINLGND